MAETIEIEHQVQNGEQQTKTQNQPTPIVDNSYSQPQKPEKKQAFKLKADIKKTSVEGENKPITSEEPKKVEDNKTEINDEKNIDLGFTQQESSEPIKPVVQAQPPSWKEVLKGVDRAELFKELGIEEDDAFETEFKNFRRNGGDPYQYLEAKTKDWNKVNNKSLILADLAIGSPNSTPEELEEIFNIKYNQDELADEREKKLGEFEIRRDADKIRQAKIEEQKKFSIPEISATVSKPEEVIKQYQDQLNMQQMEATKQNNEKYLQHPATKTLQESKKVTIPAGEFGEFNIAVNPEEITNFFTDRGTYLKHVVDEKGEPDINKENIIAMIRIVGLKKYNEALIRYGKQQATKALIEDGQNAQKPIVQQPSTEKRPLQWRST